MNNYNGFEILGKEGFFYWAHGVGYFDTIEDVMVDIEIYMAEETESEMERRSEDFLEMTLFPEG
jgi:hypothetical protein